MGRVNALSYNPDAPAVFQTVDWTCSACSLAWLNGALYIDHATDEWSAVDYIGNPENINPEWGLMDGSGDRLVQCLREQGAPALNGWFDWHTAYQLALRWPLLIGGVGWNHWAGVRSASVNQLLLANPAPGWMGVNGT